MWGLALAQKPQGSVDFGMNLPRLSQQTGQTPGGMSAMRHRRDAKLFAIGVEQQRSLADHRGDLVLRRFVIAGFKQLADAL